jgi:hypothetical protein
MSIFTNPEKVLHNAWDKVTSLYSSKIAPFLKTVERDAIQKGEDVLIAVGKDVFAQAKAQLGSGAKIGDVIKAAVELGLPELEKQGVTAATALLFNVVSSLAIAIETHAAAE